MLCVHIYIFNRKISATFDSEKQYSVIQEAKDNMKKHLLCLITTILIAASLNAQPNYNYEKLQREDLGRGVVAIRKDASTVTVSWRYLSSDPMDTGFNVYRNGKKITPEPVNAGTFYDDSYASPDAATYEVRPVVKGKETNRKNGRYTLPANAPTGYIQIPMQKPANGVTPAGDTYTYSPNDASIGDVDGDGEYEIILKWDPSNSHDNAHDGYTGEVLIDCYRLNGEQLWRINLGKNIRAGAHYTQFMVYDLDNDGKAEIVMRTADGSIDGKGNVIGDTTADYREPGEMYTPRKKKGDTRSPAPRLRNQGRIFKGKEYLTVFSGMTGEALQSIEYIPQRGELKGWGDNRANRSDRFLACIAYLDGIHPSVVMCRGYYARTVLAAFNWDGKNLKNHWTFDTDQPGNEHFAGQGNHNLRVADIDGDGCDEIVYGSMTVDHNGKSATATMGLSRKQERRLYIQRSSHRKGHLPIAAQHGCRPLHGSGHRPHPARSGNVVGTLRRHTQYKGRGCGTQSEEAPDKHGCMVGRRFATGDARQECHQ